MTRQSHLPPALAEALLALFLPKGQLGSSVLGDLRQDYSRQCNSVTVTQARRWYWRQALSLTGYYLGSKVRPVVPNSVRQRSNTLDWALQDIRYAIRVLRRSPGYTIVSVLTLAVGIGGTTAMFSVVNAVLLRPLPYAEPDRLVRVWGLNRGRLGNVSPHDVLDWQQQSRTLDGIAALTGRARVLTGSGEAERIVGLAATSELFGTLGVSPALGRFFTKQEDTPGSEPAVVLGHGFWTRRFGRDSSVVGTRILLDGIPRLVTGVLSASFFPPVSNSITEPEFVEPLQLSYDTNGRGGHWLRAVARLQPGVSVEQADAEMSALQEAIAERYAMPNFLVRLERLDDTIVGDHRLGLFVLLGAVAVVLMIGCANIANLSLARATARAREVSTRAALGAGRRRLFTQYLVESILLSALGGTMGLGLAWIGTNIVVKFGPQDVPRLGSNGIDLVVLAFALAVSLATGIAFGILPALRSSRPGLRAVFQDGGRSVTDNRKQRRLRHGFIVLQTALSLVLLVAAGLLLRSFWSLQQVKTGFDPDNVVTAEISLPAMRYSRPAVAPFFRELEGRLRRISGVERVGSALALPLSGWHSCNTFALDDRPDPPPAERTCVEERVVTPEYFNVMGMTMLAGRAFGEADDQDAIRVAIINETFARRFWPDGNPLDTRFAWGDRSADADWRTVVGVVQDVRHFGLNRPVEPEVYWTYAQTPWYRDRTLTIRATGDVAALLSQVRSEVASMDADLPLFNVNTMGGLISESLRLERFRTLLLTLFAASALLLSVVGIYGVMAYTVAQRTHEIGLRMALGAQRKNVMGVVIREGLTLAVAGVGLGLLGTLAVTRVLEGLLFEVTPTDPITIGAVSVLLVTVAGLAAYVPAGKATTVDPMAALRVE